MKRSRSLQTLLLPAAAGLWLLALGTSASGEEGRAEVYRSPWAVAFSPDGRTLAVSDHTAGSVVFVDASGGEVLRETKVRGRPTGIAWSADGQSLYVAECTAGTVAEIDTTGRVVRRMGVGPRPVGLALAPRRGWLVAANSGIGTVSILRLADGRERARVRVGRMPYLLAITPDESLAVVGSRLPAMDASDPATSAVVSLVDLESGRQAAAIRLPSNSTNVHGVAVSPDGRWAHVVHNLARAMLPTEQIEYGWINANAMSTIDLTRRQRYATILLDRFDKGAANPWGAAVSPDGSALWISLSGVHQVGRLDLNRLHGLLEKELPKVVAASGKEAEQDGQPSTARGAMHYSDSWKKGLEDPTSVEVVISDLPAEYGQGRYLGRILRRIDLPGNGPRGLAISPDGKRLAAASYYSGTVSLVDPASATVSRVVAMPDRPEVDAARRGEMIFHDAKYCFQHWLSCATCHPDGRADGLNWDLLNDGIGNPKNTRSLLLSHRTPPTMSRGIRPNMASAASAGFQFILFQEPEPEDLQAVQAYLRCMRAARSPYLVEGRLSEKARRGKVVFKSPKTRCSACHPAPLFTDLKMHEVGTRTVADEAGRFDTPTLIELWRTAPYLHHGRTTTLREVLTKENSNDKHGRTSHLSDRQIDALVEFLRSL